MPTLDSPDLGPLEYQTEDLIDFPLGLPSFEALHRFLLAQRPDFAPFLFLVSVDRPAVRFVCLAASALDPNYGFEVLPDEEGHGVIPPGPYLARATAPMILAVVTVHRDCPSTANLLAPLVIDAERRVGVQLILGGSAYSHVTPLPHAQQETAPC
jgi:flagellar assembly factor FliW